MRSLLNRFPASAFVTTLLAAGALSGCMESSSPTANDLAAAALDGVSPTITSHPRNTTVTVGDRFAIEVAAYGSATLQYAWQKCDYSTCTNIPFANGPSYSRVSHGEDTAHSYRCRVSNAYGSVYSVGARNSPRAKTNQAENGILTGAVVSSSGTGYTGTGFIAFPHMSGGNVVVNPSPNNAGTYTLFMRYSSIAPHSVKIEVNGIVRSASTSLPITQSYNNYWGIRLDVPLNAGTNTVKVTTLGWGGPHIDSFWIM